MKRRVIIVGVILLLCGIRAFCATLPRVAGQWPGIPAGSASHLNVLGNTLFADIYGNIAVIDITDSTRPTRVGTIRIPGHPRVTTAGPYLLERNNIWFRFMDVKERTSPVEVSRVEGTFSMPIVVWPYLYTLRSGDPTMMIYDATNLRQPIAIHPQVAGKLQPLQASGDRLAARELTAAQPTLRFLDISNRTNPVRGASYWSDGFMLMRGNVVFFFRDNGTVRTVDVTDVANPKNLVEWTFGNPSRVLDVVRVGDFFWVSSSNSEIMIVDMKDPTQPKAVGAFSTISLLYGHAQKGNDLFLADHKGITILDVTNPASPTIKGEIVTAPFYGKARVIADKVMLHNWFGPTILFDVTNAVRPTVFGQLPASYASLLAGDKLFLRDTEDFVNVYDASDFQHLKELSRLKFDELGFTMAATATGDRLFVSCSNTIKVVSFSNPSAMVVENSIAVPGRWNHRMARTGARLVVSANFSDSYLSVVDISDPGRPTVVSTVTNSAYFGEVAAKGNAVYVCSTEKLLMFEIDQAGGLNERGAVNVAAGDVAVSGDRLAAILSRELRIYDVSSPFAPKLLGGLTDMPVDMSRVIILGDYAYIAGGNSGLITVQLAGEPPTQPFLDIINEGEMHRIRWTADFAYPFMVSLPAVDGPWRFQPTFNDTKMFIEATVPNQGGMQFYYLLK